MITEVDKDGTGKISFADFLSVMTQKMVDNGKYIVFVFKIQALHSLKILQPLLLTPPTTTCQLQIVPLRQSFSPSSLIAG